MGREYMGASEGVWGHLTALSARAQGGNKTPPPVFVTPTLVLLCQVLNTKCSLVSPASILDSTKLVKGKNIFLYYHHIDKRGYSSVFNGMTGTYYLKRKVWLSTNLYFKFVTRI